jgi:hypothetical protein
MTGAHRSGQNPSPAFAGNDEVHFEPLPVAKEVDLAPASG